MTPEQAQAIKTFQRVVTEAFTRASVTVADSTDRWLMAQHWHAEDPDGIPYCLQHKPPEPWPCDVYGEAVERIAARRATRDHPAT